jgi:hypothetical protein
MKARILALAEALDVSVAKSVRNDECSTPRIIGRDGHAYADGAGFLIVCHPHRTAHRWTNIKRNLSFCRLTQDGDDEGCFHLDHLPDEHEAGEIRAAIHVRRKVQLSADEVAARAARFSAAKERPLKP